MKFKIIIMILALTFFVSAESNGKITGTIKDKETGELLQGINVAILNMLMGASTDVDGYFVILNVPPGIYTVRAAYIGYKEVNIDSVVVKASRVTHLNIELEATAIVDSIVGIEPLTEIVSKPALQATAKELKHTIITPHLEHNISPGMNVLWCNTFQLAWNEMCDLAGGPINMKYPPPILPVLNKMSVSKNDLDEDSYIAMAGRAGDEFYEKIREEYRRKFKKEAPPEPLAYKVAMGLAAYAHLFKMMPFKWAFDRFSEDLLFEGYYVDSFGIDQLTSLREDSMASQVAILEYKNADDLIIELKTQAEDDRLILAKVLPKATLVETIKMVEKRIQKAKPTQMQWNENLSIPVLNFDVLREYSELYGGSIETANKAFDGQNITLANQSIRLQLDERGAVLISTAEIVTVGLSRQYAFNKPFLILLRRREAENPYFALWVGNAELLVPVQKKSFEDKWNELYNSNKK